MIGEILAAGAVAVAVLLAEQQFKNLPNSRCESRSERHHVDLQIDLANRIWRRLIFELSGAMPHLGHSGLSERAVRLAGAIIALIIISPFGLMAVAISSHRDQELQRVERVLENIKRAQEDLDRHHSKMIGQMAVAIDAACREIDCQPLPADIQQSAIETRLNEHRVRERKSDSSVAGFWTIIGSGSE